MPSLNDRLRRVLRRAAPVPSTDDVRASLQRRRRARELRRRAGSSVLAVAVIAGSVGGVVGLRRTFSVADGTGGMIAFSRTLRACYDHPNVGGPQVDAFAVTPDGSKTWNLTNDARWAGDRARGEEQVAVAPDGARFAWVDGYRGGILVTDVLTGVTERIVKLPGTWSPAWSPDGTTIAYTASLTPSEMMDPGTASGAWDEAADASVFVVAAEGGDPTLLARDAFGALWSPDGSTIAFMREETNARRERNGVTSTLAVGHSRQSLWMMNADGSNERLVEVAPSDSDWSVVEGDWAPDGERFAVEVDFGGNHDIVLVNIEARTGIRLTDDPAADTSPSWSPDGTVVAFSTGRWGSGVGHGEIATIDAEGVDLHRVTNDCWDDFDPDWVAASGTVESTPTWAPPPAPDLGTAGVASPGQILFSTTMDGVEDVFAIDPETGERTNLTADLVSQFSPSWSPDHTEIAFGAYDGRTGERALSVMSADGTDLRSIAEGGSSPDWHPDGSTIAFIAADGAVMLIAPDGSGLRDSGFGSARSVSWAPDGRRLAIEIKGNIYVGDLTTGDAQRLTTDPPGTNYEVAWSPASDTIAFTHERDVFVVQANGTGLTNLTPGHGDAYDRSPAWSPDGTELVFASDRDAKDAMRLYIMHADGSDVRVLSRPLGNCCPYPDW
jgi:Tol biopolymer transport system component